MASQSTQPPATNPVPQELTNNDLALLLNTLNPVASKCFALGLQLGVNDSRIRNIRSNNSQCEDQLREIISERLRQESPLTWDDIARALRADSVSENRLASEIENKYIHHLPPPVSVASQANTPSLATSSLTSSLQSSSQCETSPSLAHSSASVASTDTIVHIPLSKLPLKYSRHIQSISSGYPRPSTSASTVSTASANSECKTLTKITIPFSKLPPSVSQHFQSQSLLSAASTSSHNLTSTAGSDCGTQTKISIPISKLSRRVSEFATVKSSNQQFSYSDVMDRHCVALTDAIHGDLVTVSNKFLELGFVTRTATDDILSKNGISSREKANQLLSLVTSSHDRSHDKKEWFDKFTSVFSSEAAYEGLVSELKEASHKMMGSATLVPRPHHKCSAKTHRKRKVVSGSSGSFSQATKRLQMRGHDSDDEPMKVRKKGGRAEGSIEVKRKKKSSRDIRSSSMTSLIGRGVMNEKSSSVSVEKRGRGGPTTRAREELSSEEEEVVYQGTEQRSFTEFTSESDDNRQGRRTHEHTSESSSSSAESSTLTSSSAEEEEGKRPDSRHVSRKKRRRRRLAMWFTSKKRKPVFKGGGRKGKGRQLQHTSSGHLSGQYLNDRDPPQSVKQAPGREHYQSQQGPKQSQSSSSTQAKSPMDLFIEYVKDTYRQSAIEKDLNVIKWPPTPCEVFISLAIIDRKIALTKGEVDGYTRAMVEDGNIDVILKKKDSSIDFDNIARGLPQTDSSQNVIVVEGAPGVGKSTFAWEFCRRWERGEIAQQYQLVLLLRLRDDRTSKAKSLEDLIYHPRQDICQGVLHELLGNGGINTLIILEGFDELPDDQRKESSFFLMFILGKLLLHATILVTSRPWATSAVMRKIDHRVFQHIEVLGFTEESIERYVTSVFTGKNAGTHSVERVQ